MGKAMEVVVVAGHDAGLWSGPKVGRHVEQAFEWYHWKEHIISS